MSAYDFFNDEFPDDERVPYKLMQWLVLKYCYTICRRAIKDRYGKIWKWADEYTQACHESYFESTSALPIEQLMFEVFILIMLGGRGTETVERSHYGKIASILEKHDLQAMLNELPDNERFEFEHDLRLLKLIP